MDDLRSAVGAGGTAVSRSDSVWSISSVVDHYFRSRWL